MDSAREGPIAQFGQFVNGRLKLIKARTTELDYVAISHVWGKIEWIPHIPNVDGEVLASPSKAIFIEKKLPGLVGDTAFWMDTLTVDQRNKAEVIATVQIIPTIFRDAVRTIAIREGGGIYRCCATAVGEFTTWQNFQEKILKHSEKHLFDALYESYLQRLWTLQECLLSHTIEFVIDSPEQPEKAADTSDFYRYQTEIERICDSLYALAQCFAGGVEDIDRFIKAYINGGVIGRPKLPERDETEDIHTGLFREHQLASHRCATMPRDYIFATMPQFPWYHYPLEAEQMQFSEIFTDLFQQASRGGHAFACKLTQSMTDPKCTSGNAWLPSLEQPEPKCLGDFLKLLGQRLPNRAPGSPDNIHLTTPVKLMEVPDHGNTILVLIESAMHFSERKWQESHKGGELSKYGSFPNASWELNPLDAMHSGWAPKNGEWAQQRLGVIEDGDETIMMLGTFQEWEEDPMEELMIGIFGNYDEEKQEYVTLHEQSRKVLDHMWCGLDRSLNPAQASDWAHFRRDMRGMWSKPLLRMILLQAAMISCGIGLSATTWMRRKFVPVCVKYNSLNLLGLLAKHARSEGPRQMFSVGRHLKGTSFGKDLVLVDPATKLAVGLLPDFLPLIRTEEEFVERSHILYRGLLASVGPQGASFAHVPPDKWDQIRESIERRPSD